MTDTNAIPVEEVIKKRGRPRKEVELKSDNIKKADVVTDNAIVDIWLVRNKDPKLVYKWGRMNDDMEMMEFAAKSYMPATGKEIIVGNPFEATKCGEGERKIRGNRILMCCPKTIVDARRKDEAQKYKKASDSANQEARSKAAKSSLGTLSITEEEETVRESILEPVSK